MYPLKGITKTNYPWQQRIHRVGKSKPQWERTNCVVSGSAFNNIRVFPISNLLTQLNQLIRQQIIFRKSTFL